MMCGDGSSVAELQQHPRYEQKYIILQPAVSTEILAPAHAGRQQVIEWPLRSKKASESRTDETRTSSKRQRCLLV